MSPGRNLVVLLLMLLPLAGAQTASAPAPDFSQLDAVVLQELAQVKAPGAALAVVKDDRVVFAKGYGVANVETGTPVEPQMLFRLGSTTKMFTAATLVSLALEGRIGLDDPAGKVVAGLHPQVAALTPRQLLSHTAGLWDEAPMFGSHDDAALAAGIRGWNGARFFTEPGRIYSYSNPGYWLAGLISESIAGKPFADVVKARLLDPLGMTRSNFRPTLAMTYPLALGHEPGNDGKPAILRPMADNSAGWPAGSLFSSVEELAKWVIAFLNAGRIEGRQALPAALFEHLSTPQAAIPGGKLSYGFGLQIAEERGHRILSHGGSRSGYGSMIRMAPASRTGVIVLVNSSGQSLPKSTARAWELAMGWEPAATTAPPASAATSEELRAIAGRYVAGPRNLEFEVQDGKLFGRTAPGAPLVSLTPTGPLAFQAPGFGEVVFVRTWTGEVEFVFSGGRSARKVTGQ